MKEHPILFSATMVQAILSSQKTQTRRSIKPQPQMVANRTIEPWSGDPLDLQHLLEKSGKRCHYGQPGDKLWVRETHYRFGHWEPVSGMLTKIGRQKWQFVEDGEEVLYEPPTVFRKGRHRDDSATPAWHKRQAMFMPRIASRTQLEIVSVRVQRLQDISEADTIAEGVTKQGQISGGLYVANNPRGAYLRLWEDINGHGSWAANPWVWAIEFKRIDVSA